MERECLTVGGFCITVDGMTSFVLIFPWTMVVGVTFGITRQFNAKTVECSGSQPFALLYFGYGRLSYF